MDFKEERTILKSWAKKQGKVKFEPIGRSLDTEIVEE
jgi:hypothetical protein